MKLIESKAEYIPQEEGLEGIYKQIELAGRTAYHSLDKITPTSAKDFVDRMIKSKHGAALEHGTVYLFYSVSCYDKEGQKWISKYESNPYSKVICVGVDDNEPAEDGNYYDLIGNEACGNEQYVITINYRVLIENNWRDDLQYLCSPTEFHEKRYTMRFTCSRAIAQELTRHRRFSFLMESQRYINYSKERHGGGITFIIPSWVDRNREPNTEAEVAWLDAMKKAEYAYLDMINGISRKGIVVMPADEKLTPQQARDVLPNATKTELIMTGFSSDWRHVLDLRLFEKTGKVAPDMLDLMQKAQKTMQEAGIWEDIMSKPSKFE
jgi:thymidylate synthase (FAD)